MQKNIIVALDGKNEIGWMDSQGRIHISGRDELKSVDGVWIPIN